MKSPSRQRAGQHDLGPPNATTVRLWLDRARAWAGCTCDLWEEGLGMFRERLCAAAGRHVCLPALVLASVGALAGWRLGWSSRKVGPLRRLTAETSSTPPHKRLVHSQPVLRAAAGFVSTEPEAVVIARIGIGLAFGCRAVRTRVASVGPEVCPIPSPPLHGGP